MASWWSHCLSNLPILGEPMMKNSTCIVLLCLVTACAQSEREASIDSTESYPVIEAMVEVPAGNFWMGCNLDVDAECKVEREAPMREVQLKSFEIDVYEVTAGDYRACVVAGACLWYERGKQLLELCDGP